MWVEFRDWHYMICYRPFTFTSHGWLESANSHTGNDVKDKSTVEPVLKTHCIGHTNVVSQDRWFLGLITMKSGLSARSNWSFKTGGLSWQWSLKTGYTVPPTGFEPTTYRSKAELPPPPSLLSQHATSHLEWTKISVSSKDIPRDYILSSETTCMSSPE